ncbi:rhodanese-like domain-containing protein [Pontivivens nitratireducens]|uniref:rhodanese-like domain-containing protein n=1 Tax=Pontivivens nitratireducens TaxID=2758038 RepID=UPI00163B435A|nr:rhodanese-like domain-containing protein [Pontibrevibacter nitratireducens]
MTSLKDRVSSAKADVPTISVADAMELHGRDDVTFVDVREPPETAQGTIAGAEAIPRGTLEFAVDQSAPSAKAAFADPSKTYVFYCASGGRAALAAQTAKSMGLDDARAMENGFGEWKENGGPTQ